METSYKASRPTHSDTVIWNVLFNARMSYNAFSKRKKETLTQCSVVRNVNRFKQQTKTVRRVGGRERHQYLYPEMDLMCHNISINNYATIVALQSQQQWYDYGSSQLFSCVGLRISSQKRIILCCSSCGQSPSNKTIYRRESIPIVSLCCWVVKKISKYL